MRGGRLGSTYSTLTRRGSGMQGLPLPHRHAETTLEQLLQVIRRSISAFLRDPFDCGGSCGKLPCHDLQPTVLDKGQDRPVQDLRKSKVKKAPRDAEVLGHVVRSDSIRCVCFDVRHRLLDKTAIRRDPWRRSACHHAQLASQIHASGSTARPGHNLIKQLGGGVSKRFGIG